jgi:hypothetical protein
VHFFGSILAGIAFNQLHKITCYTGPVLLYTSISQRIHMNVSQNRLGSRSRIYSDLTNLPKTNFTRCLQRLSRAVRCFRFLKLQ